MPALNPGAMTVDGAAALLQQDAVLQQGSVGLRLPGCELAIRSNSGRLLDRLRDYYRHVIAPVSAAALEVIAIERDEPDLDITWTDWSREPGKTGRKDSYHDIDCGRLVRKVRTGMVFLQSADQRIAAGACLRYDNQLINFIASQYMNLLQQQGWLICHASGLVTNGRCLAMAGLSGGGKSTLMLRMMDDEAMTFLTNDRLFVKRTGDRVQARGIPKLPRINPGTIVHNPRLQPMIEAGRRAQLLDLPVEELWHLEEKFDVDIEQLYGKGRITHEAGLGGFLILDWSRDSSEALSLEQADLASQPELLTAIMKSPGPFYQYADGRFYQDHTAMDPQDYIEALRGVDIYVARGRIDFEALAERCKRLPARDDVDA
jgi:HprK-related kinase B